MNNNTNNTSFDFSELINEKPIDSSYAKNEIFKLLINLESENDIEKRKELTKQIANLVSNEFAILAGVAYKYKGAAISLYNSAKCNNEDSKTSITR